jgi:hypothetical protein
MHDVCISLRIDSLNYLSAHSALVACSPELCRGLSAVHYSARFWLLCSSVARSEAAWCGIVIREAVSSTIDVDEYLSGIVSSI